jgi:hypothetical protein
MSNVPTNLIPTRITQLPEAPVADPAGYFPIVISGTTYKVQFSQISSNVQVPASRVINAGTGLTGGGSLSADITIAVANGGIGNAQLDTTGVSAGTYGDGTNIPVVTVNTVGRVTSLSTTPLVISGYVPDSRQIVAGSGLSGGGNLDQDRTLAIDFSSATPEPLGAATAGTGVNAAREDHVHPAVDLSDGNETTGELPMSRGGTGANLSPIAGAIVYSNGTNFDLSTAGNNGQVLTSTGGGPPTWTTITGVGTVTSVDGSGGTTGLTVSGGPITTAGTLTLGGTLAISAGGTGLAGTPTNGQLLIGDGSGYALSTLTAGTAISVTNATGSISIANTAPDQTVTLTDGTAISVTGTYPSFTVTNSAPDQTVIITGGGLISVTGTYPSFTVDAAEGFSGTVTSIDVSSTVSGLTFSGGPVTDSGVITMAGTLGISSGGTGLGSAPTNGQLLIGDGSGFVLNTLTAGTGITVTDATGSISIANAAPDQTVILTSGGGTVVSGAYPSFTISTTVSAGSVTSVDVSGGITGLTFSGGPVTDSGTITMAGTLAITNGGTGASTQSDARTALGLGTIAVQDANSVSITGGSIGSGVLIDLTNATGNISGGSY